MNQHSIKSIGMVLDNEFTGDMRVENEVISLQEAGFQVYVLCLNYGIKLNEDEFYGAKIIRIKLSLFIKNKMKGLCNTMFDVYTWYWGRKLVKFIKKYNIKVLHCHDLYMLGAAFYANKRIKNKCTIVADLHENYPEALKNYKFTKTFLGKFVISIPKWEKTEVEWLKKSDYIITVIEEAVSRYTKLGIPFQKLTVVANYVNETQFSKENNFDIISRFKNKKIASYIGGFDIHRGLEAVIKSIPYIVEIIPSFMLILVGAGRNENDLKQIVKKLHIEEYVSFEGFQPPKNLPSYIFISEVCLIPHLKTPHTDNTIPHKLFHYMVMGKAVLASNCNPLQRIINESKAGLIFKSNCEKDIAKKIIQILSDSQKQKMYGMNGKKAVLEKYNWESTAKNLINLYTQIFSKITTT